MSIANIIAFDPSSGSVNGNELVTIAVSGVPENEGQPIVFFGSSAATNVSFTYQQGSYEITCFTPKSSNAKSVYIYVTIGTYNLVSTTTFSYTSQASSLPKTTLTPTYGLGSYGRTGPAIAIGGSRSKIGSQSRIFHFYNARGQGQAYQQYLIEALSIQFLPRVSRWSMM